MKTTKLTIAALAGSFIALASMNTPAHACTTSTWSKTGGDSFADTIQGRDCGGTYSVRFKGGFGDTGWVPMFKNGFSDFRAQWGDGQVLTDINMKVMGASMNANFVHKNASGTSTTHGTYHLTGN